jgi:hypothetical protein
VLCGILYARRAFLIFLKFYDIINYKIKKERIFKMLIGIDRINKILTDFLQECGYDDIRVKEDTDFCYYPVTQVIGYSFLCPQRDNDLFLEFIKDLKPLVTFDIFLWSFLHELGHYETYDDLDEDELAYSFDVKTRLQKLYVVDNQYYNQNVSTIFKEYFSLPDEYAATTWAVNFANKNIDKLWSLWNKLQPAIMNFYTMNNITED